MTADVETAERRPSAPIERALPGGGAKGRMVSLSAAEAKGSGELSRLPRSMKVLAEDVLARLGPESGAPQLEALLGQGKAQITFQPSRALLQDFMGIPLMTDLASLRDAASEAGVDPASIDPVIPCDFVTDHSLSVMVSARPDALPINRRMELDRNLERFAFIKWAQGAFGNFRVIPPGRRHHAPDQPRMAERGRAGGRRADAAGHDDRYG